MCNSSDASYLNHVKLARQDPRLAVDIPHNLVNHSVSRRAHAAHLYFYHVSLSAVIVAFTPLSCRLHDASQAALLWPARADRNMI
jgi:hypothetical protein